MQHRAPIFDEIRLLLGRKLMRADVVRIDAAIDRALGTAGPQTTIEGPSGAPGARKLGIAGEALIKAWEGCHRRRADGQFEAYPDPGSANGRPWTIGWGSTGTDIGRGTVWNQEQCDARFAAEIGPYVREVERAIGDAPTADFQFDALVSFHYNTGAIGRATLTRLHKAGRFAEAETQFARWIYNDGHPMAGLRNRRAAEARLYAGG